MGQLFPYRRQKGPKLAFFKGLGLFTMGNAHFQALFLLCFKLFTL